MKKFAKIHTVYQILQGVWTGVILSLCFLSNGLEEELTETQIFIAIAVGAGVFLLNTVYAFLYRALSGYQITDTEIVVKRGVLFRKESRLLRTRIHAVNRRANLIQRMLRLCVIQADSGSANTPNEEITIFETETVAETIYQSLTGTAKEAEAPSPDTFYDFTTGRKILYGITQSFFALIFPFACAVVIGVLVGYLPEEEPVTVVDTLLFSLIILVAMYLLLFLISIPASLLRFHAFEAKRTGEKIEVNYGLLTKVHNSFALSRIRAVEISDNLLKRMFGFVTVKLHVIGYLENGNSNQNGMEIGLLFPLIRRTEVDGALSAILPDYLPEEETTKAKQFFPFLSWNLCFLAILTAVVLAVLSTIYTMTGIIRIFTVGGACLGAFDLLFVLLLLWGKRMEYQFTGFCLSPEKATLKKGGFCRSSFVIQRRNLTSIERITTPLRERNGIVSYRFHFRSNFFLNTVDVPIQDAALQEETERYLRY